MWGRSFGWAVFLLAALLILHCPALATAKAVKSTPWLTLSGNAPAIIAKGGFSGLFPDSSLFAYQFTYAVSSADTISWCDVHLTKDGVGICLPDIKMDTFTDISVSYPNGNRTYLVNGLPTLGWFSVDYNIKDLTQVYLTQGVFSRPPNFDNIFPILTVEDVETNIKPPVLWLNIQHDVFYRDHNLSMKSYLISLSRRVDVNYVSSPEVSFLSSIVSTFKGGNMKLIFRFLDIDTMEPSINQTYGSLLKNLTFIRTFASGIIIPKHYIWPVTSDLYLQPHTSVVLDAHKEGLEVFASDFANDASTFSYNYSYDPLAEYLSFIDNGIFSVDGVLTDFPVTASEAIGCYSQTNKNNSEPGKPFVISHNGASGIYPSCTDLAYQQAVKDGADVIDCPVQVTKDGILICMGSINLMDDTTVTTSPFRTSISHVPEIQSTFGIFTFNLTWEEIQKNLKPTISNPQLNYHLQRNLRYRNAGNFMTLDDFLSFANGKALLGILIIIEHAAFLAEKLGYSVTDAVIGALKDAGYNNQTTQEISIQSTNSSVLKKFKQHTNYKLVYMIEESICNAVASSVADIKQFAHSVAISKQSIYPDAMKFITGQTDLVKKLQSAGLSVYAYLLTNEYTSQAWDFFSDPTVEINALVQGVGVDGVITDFPGTATQYKRNTCLKMGDKAPIYMSPVKVGDLLSTIPPQAQPPVLPPMPVLEDSDVLEPPLPPASRKPSTPATGGNAVTPASQPSSTPHQTVVSILALVVMLSGPLLLIWDDGRRDSCGVLVSR